MNLPSYPIATLITPVLFCDYLKPIATTSNLGQQISLLYDGFIVGEESLNRGATNVTISGPATKTISSLIIV